MRSLAGIRKIVQSLQTTTVRILAATLDTRTGKPRKILTSDGLKHDPPVDLTVEQLPRGCLIHHYDPSTECAILYRDSRNGRGRVQRLIGIDEEVALGFKPFTEQPEIFAEGKQPC
jgi:hypothetical protein